MSVTPAAAFMGVQAIGAITSAYGQYKAGQQEQGAYNYNAGISEQQAQATRAAEALNEYKKRKEIDAVIGAQQVGYAKSGVVINTGSPIDVMTESLANGYLDIAIDKYNSEVAARSLESQASLERYYGANAAALGKERGIMSLLQTGSSLAYNLIPSGSKKNTNDKIGS